MVNGLGVVGWGVGGIEAEAAMLGQPSSMLIPKVVGYKLTGRLPEGTTATDLVLTITEALRKRGVVGKFVEFFGPGLKHLTIADRVTLGQHVSGVRRHGCRVPDRRHDARIPAGSPAGTPIRSRWSRRTRGRRGCSAPTTTPDAMYSETLELDLGTVEPSLAGPRRPQDRVPLGKAKTSFAAALPDLKKGVKTTPKAPASGGGAAVAEAAAVDVDHGSVVIAAITSCTNTSNPSVMIAAGLVAKRAVERGLKSKPWVKTSLAPGSKVVTDYLAKAGLQPFLDAMGFNLVGYGCTTCIGNSGPLPDEVAAEVRERGLVVCSVLSGNRNFEGRIQQDVRANYLASPPLVVAYALAGSLNVDLTTEPLGMGRDGKPVYLKDLWPTGQEIQQTMLASISAEMFRSQYAKVFDGAERWRALPVPTGDRFAWEADSTYIRRPPFLENLTREPAQPSDIMGARVACAARRQHHHRSHLAGRFDQGRQPRREVLDRARAWPPKDFNSYGARRGNHEVMMRGTFANVRLRNALAPGTEGGWTTLPARRRGHVDLRRVGAYRAGGRAADRPCRQGIRIRFVARLGRQGHDAARREGRHRRELRAHPPQQSRQHGRAAARVRCRE